MLMLETDVQLGNDFAILLHENKEREYRNCIIISLASVFDYKNGAYEVNLSYFNIV
jgi:hypothetical protein